MRILLCLVLMGSVSSGCSCSNDDPVTVDAGPMVDGGGDPDAGPRDAGPGDAGDDAGSDAGPGDAGPGVTTREITFQTSGGGESFSPGFRLRLSVGAPQPMGTASNTNNRVITGPAAARP